MFDVLKETNFILACDSYKVGHIGHLPFGTKKIHSNIVPRKAFKDSDHGIEIREVVVVGPQVVAEIFKKVRITTAMIDEAEKEITEQGYDFPRDQWEYIRDYDTGQLPLCIRAVPEGTVITPGTPCMTIENTDEVSAWLVSYVETLAQDIVWTMSTSASLLRWLRKQADLFCRLTGSPAEAVEYMIHNFGDRGAGGQDRAIMVAISHALFFSGSDCLRANRYIKTIYRTNKPVLSSVDANEHSTVCSNSDCENKNDYAAFRMSLDTLRKAVDRAKRGVGIPLISALIDTFDDERYLGFVLDAYNEICEIGGKYVCRPDSGDAVKKPIEVVKILLQGLEEKYRMTSKNDKGFRTLPGNLGVIQGDGLKLWNFEEIFHEAMINNLAASNFVFGFGGGMTNGVNRDQFSFSMKATGRMTATGDWVEMQKQPKTDAGKASLKGRVTAVRDENGVVKAGAYGDENDAMLTIYSLADNVYVAQWDDVRARARS